MATAVIMPKQGQSVETCIITRWFMTRGDKVSAGDILCSYETDKAAFDLESPADGILLEIFFGEGSEVPVLSNIAVIGQSGEDIASFSQEQNESGTTGTVTPSVPEVASTAAVSVMETSPIGPDEKIRISPRAKRIAAEKGIDYVNIAGSGPNGRIVAADIEAVASVKPAAAKTAGAREREFTEQPLSNVRKLISRAMYTSLQNSAQLTHHMSADVRQLLDTRQKIKEEMAAGKKRQDITLNDMICWCVIRALQKFPEVNSHFLDDRIRTFQKVHLGIAVDTPRGLMVPVVRDASDMDLDKLSASLKRSADESRKGSINPELIQSTAATFTVSNLGNYGVEMFTPVINLPQVGILGVCAIINRPASLGNNIFGFVPYIGLSLTYDHRAVDGAPATLFLKEIKEQIENFRYL
jgi:pyruvate dehydrogenase E2 component (dihydrolipoamide acetyltransferase)